MLSQQAGHFPIPVGNFRAVDLPVKPGRLAVHYDADLNHHKVAFINADNHKEVFIINQVTAASASGNGGDPLVEDLSDIIDHLLKDGDTETAIANRTINQIAFGADSNILYASVKETGKTYEIHIDEREVNQLRLPCNNSTDHQQGTPAAPACLGNASKYSSMFTDHSRALYVHNDTHIMRVCNPSSADTGSELLDQQRITTYAKTIPISFNDGTTCIDSQGCIHSLQRKPFCTEFLVSVYDSPNGNEIRTYGNNLLYYGETFAISRKDYTVAGEGDTLMFFSPDGRLYKTIKGFGLISGVQVSTNDTLFIADSWYKQIMLFTFSYPPTSLYDQCIRQTLLYLDDLHLRSLPHDLQHLLKDYSFRVKIEIWSTRELEIAYTEVLTHSDCAPIRRGRTESRSVVCKNNSKRFYLKLKLGIEFDMLRQMIGSRLNRSIENMVLYTVQYSMPSKLPELGILKQEHRKIAVVFV